VILLGSSRRYRLDNIEIIGSSRGGPLGRFTIALIAARACELSAGVILACPPELVLWYQTMGAIDASSLGWKYPGGLRALQFDEPAAQRLKEFADALEKE
jgi:hypothetical protein